MLVVEKKNVLMISPMKGEGSGRYVVRWACASLVNRPRSLLRRDVIDGFKLPSEVFFFPSRFLAKYLSVDMRIANIFKALFIDNLTFTQPFSFWLVFVSSSGAFSSANRIYVEVTEVLIEAEGRAVIL